MHMWRWYEQETCKQCVTVCSSLLCWCSQCCSDWISSSLVWAVQEFKACEREGELTLPFSAVNSWEHVMQCLLNAHMLSVWSHMLFECQVKMQIVGVWMVRHYQSPSHHDPKTHARTSVTCRWRCAAVDSVDSSGLDGELLRHLNVLHKAHENMTQCP